MKIIVPAIGSRGDVQPYIALCQGLQQAGHEAVLATNPTMRALVERYDVSCAPVGPPVDMGLEGARLYARAGKNWWLGFMRTMQLGFKLVQDSYPDILTLCESADAVVATDIAAGTAEAVKLGLPWVSVTLQPDRIPKPSPSFLSNVVWGILGALMMAPVNRFRRRVGVEPVKGISGVLSERLTMVPISPHVAPPHPQWPPYAHVTGYWTAQQPQAWTPPADLLAFLEAGEQPIAVSLGAMSLAGEETRQAALMTLEAVQQAGVRAVVQGWDEALAGIDLPETVYHAGPMPHTWLFGRVGAVVHHGGFGTTGSTLCAGKPAIIVPHIIDQHLWAKRVYELGVGPEPVSRAKLTAENLAEAIVQATSDTEMCARAAKLGEQIRSEPDGLTVAVRLIEEAIQ
ncbi:MAG: glycosyltransferase family 1 protein [Anaerolineae bacterium]|nr:glycosyltransferase family 1 protein [Anaerolineae bacterium]